MKLVAVIIFVVWIMFWIWPDYLGRQIFKVYQGWANAYTEQMVRQVDDTMGAIDSFLRKDNNK